MWRQFRRSVCFGVCSCFCCSFLNLSYCVFELSLCETLLLVGCLTAVTMWLDSQFIWVYSSPSSTQKVCWTWSGATQNDQCMTTKYRESDKRADGSLCFRIALVVLWCHTLIILRRAAWVKMFFLSVVSSEGCLSLTHSDGTRGVFQKARLTYRQLNPELSVD